jgi:hypothetical protein
MHSDRNDKRINAAGDYFKLADQGRPEVLELFHEDTEIYSRSLDLASVVSLSLR